jgi:RNA polymerase sigma factor (sigma-70 family)
MTTTSEPPSVIEDALWRAYSTELLRFATVLVGPSDSHDIVVDAVLRSAGHLVDPSATHCRAYLYRAVANEAHNQRRAQQRRWRRDLAAVGPSTVDSPDIQIDVRRAVSRLSLAQRAVVFLVYWSDVTEREAAELLGVSAGTVRRHLVRARNHLRKALQ